MKNFTGKVTDVDNNGNPIKKKSGGKNGKKSGFKKPTAAKKSSGKKPLKDIAVVMTKKPVRKIVEYYYFFNEEMDARKLQSAVGEKWFEKADIWPELNLMEVEMNFDSLIFQNAEECFIDPADQQWFEEQGIKTKYQISYDTGDIESVREVLHNIMDAHRSRCGFRNSDHIGNIIQRKPACRSLHIIKERQCCQTAANGKKSCLKKFPEKSKYQHISSLLCFLLRF